MTQTNEIRAAQPALDRIINSLASEAYAYACALEAAVRDADSDELERISRREIDKFKAKAREILVAPVAAQAVLGSMNAAQPQPSDPDDDILDILNAGWRALEAQGIDAETVEMRPIYDAMMQSRLSAPHLDDINVADMAQVDENKGKPPGNSGESPAPDEHVKFEEEAKKYGLDLYRRLDGTGYNDSQTKRLFAFWKARAALAQKEAK